MKNLYLLILHAFLTGLFLVLTGAAIDMSWHTAALVWCSGLLAFNGYSTWHYAKWAKRQVKMVQAGEARTWIADLP